MTTFRDPSSTCEIEKFVRGVFDVGEAIGRRSAATATRDHVRVTAEGENIRTLLQRLEDIARSLDDSSVQPALALTEELRVRAEATLQVMSTR